MSNRRYLKVFAAQDDVDQKIQEWVDQTGSVIVDFKPLGDKIGVLYTKEEQVELARQGPPIPLAEGAKAPTITATRIYNEERRLVHAMAGIFGVPEGDKFSTEDEEAAPAPLLSPDFELDTYYDMFGNIA